MCRSAPRCWSPNRWRRWARRCTSPDARFGRVPRVYIECSGDRAITHAAQRRMQQVLTCAERITLDADHSPFFSRAAELTAALLRLAPETRG